MELHSLRSGVRSKNPKCTCIFGARFRILNIFLSYLWCFCKSERGAGSHPRGLLHRECGAAPLCARSVRNFDEATGAVTKRTTCLTVRSGHCGRGGGGTKSLFCHEWSFFSLLTPCGQTDNNASIRNQRTSTNPDRSDLDMTKMTNVWCFPRFVFSELPSRILRKQHWCLISEGHTERIACRRSARWVACPEPCSQVSKEQLLG